VLNGVVPTIGKNAVISEHREFNSLEGGKKLFWEPSQREF